jgi:mRNA interferase HigB
VRIVAKRVLMEMAARHGDCAEQVSRWYRITAKNEWRNLNDVRATFPSADQVGDRLVFNIKGNHYRLIVGVNYDTATLFIKHLLTHAEYDKETWKE